MSDRLLPAHADYNIARDCIAAGSSLNGPGLVEPIAQAIASARAEGYRAGVEAAARECDAAARGNAEVAVHHDAHGDPDLAIDSHTAELESRACEKRVLDLLLYGPPAAPKEKP